MRFSWASLSAIMAVCVMSQPGMTCCSLGPAEFSGTTGLACEAKKDGKLVHLLGYQNTVESKIRSGTGANAMLLPIPAKHGTMTSKNILDTSEATAILNNMREAVVNPTHSVPRSFTDGTATLGRVQVFEHDIYTIVLADDAKDIPAALKLVKPEKRPQLNEAIFRAYAKWYPGYTFALCCFNNKDKRIAHPMLWWYEPLNPGKLFFPALDEHSGNVPKLNSKVEVGHLLIFSSFALDAAGPKRQPETGRVLYTDRLGSELKALLPKFVVGEGFYGKMPQGDFSLATSKVKDGQEKPSEIERILPPGLHAKPLGLAAALLTKNYPETPVQLKPRHGTGNIAPYRRDMYERLAGNYKLDHGPFPIILLATDRSGKLLELEILQSSGNKKIDKEALRTAGSTKYAPLPEWYQGDRLQFKLDMEKVVYLKLNPKSTASPAKPH